MKLLYIHQYFKTPLEPGGTRSYWIAKELVTKGFDVTMISGYTGESNQKVFERCIDGIKVIYIKEDYDQSMTVLRRIRAFFSFMIKATKVAFSQRDIRLVIATSTPLTIGVPALLLKWGKRIPYIFEVRDLWPEVPIQMKALKNPILKKVAVALEKMIYKNAKHIIALSPGMQNGVLRFVSREKTSMIPNMSKKDEFWPREKNEAFQKELGLEDSTFKVIHFGSLGLANGAHTIIESAKLMSNDSTIEFLFVGGGATEKDLRVEVEKYNLTNVRFLGKFPMNKVSEIVNLSDVSIVSFLDLPILYTNSPNKLFDSLSAGKPIIVNSAGWTKDLVEEHKCGFYVDPKDPNDLVKKLRYLQSAPGDVRSMGIKSRWLAENKYDKSILCKEFVNLIEKQL